MLLAPFFFLVVIINISEKTRLWEFELIVRNPKRHPERFGERAMNIYCTVPNLLKVDRRV